MGGNPIQFDYTVLATVFSFLLLIFIVLFIVYLILRFFRGKKATEKEILQKLDELIKLQTQQSDKKP